MGSSQREMGSIGGVTREGTVWSDGLQFKELEFHGGRVRRNDTRGIEGTTAPLTAANPRSEQGGEGMEQSARDDRRQVEGNGDWEEQGIGCLRWQGAADGVSVWADARLRR